MTSFWKVKLPAGIAIVVLAAYVVFLEVQASPDSDERFGSSAVWNPGDAPLRQIREACKSSDPQDYDQCFIDHMSDAGAPPEAIDFTQEYLAEHGGLAILTDFHPLDAVDLGHVYFPEAKDEPRSLVLLNGSAEIVDGSDLRAATQKELEANPQFLSLRGTHPHVGVFAENDDGKTGGYPATQRLTRGGQRFVIDYSLRDGCASCAVFGRAELAFDFDVAGQFQGTHIIKVQSQSELGN